MLTAWYLLLLMAYAVIPGVAILVFIQFRYRYLVDAIIACLWTGFAWTVFWVYCLLFCNLYYWITALAIVVSPALYLVWKYVRKPAGGAFWPVRFGPSAIVPISGIDAAVLAAVVVLLAFYLVESFTSPITGWDASVSWDKWASDWARRHNLYNYLTGGYPQTLPMFVSVLYKMSGTYSEPLSLAQYAAHAFQPLVAVCLLLALLRLAFYFRVPAWAVVLFTFGNHVLCERIGNGDADLLLTTLMASVVVIYVSHRDGCWTSRFGLGFVLGPLLFVTLNTKVQGFLGVLFILSLGSAGGIGRRRTHLQVAEAEGSQMRSAPNETESAYPGEDRGPEPLAVKLQSLSPGSWRSLAASVALPCMLVAVFYCYQMAQAAYLPVTKLNPHETHFPPLAMTKGLEGVARATYKQASMAGRLVQSFDKVTQSFEVRPDLALPLVTLFFIALIACATVPRSRLLILPTAVGYLVWFRWASYDLRNLLPIVPMLGVCLAAGCGQLLRIGSKRLAVRAVLALAIGAFSVDAGANIVTDIINRAHLFEGPEPEIQRRLKVENLDLKTKAALFFPGEYPTYTFVRSLPLTSRAGLVAAFAYMYRWFPNGGYISMWMDQYRGGDLFIAPQPQEPPDSERWTMIQEDALRVWLFDDHPILVPLGQVLLSGPAPPKLKTLTPDLLELEPQGVLGAAM